jgi:hypothetical protein
MSENPVVLRSILASWERGDFGRAERGDFSRADWARSDVGFIRKVELDPEEG